MGLRFPRRGGGGPAPPADSAEPFPAASPADPAESAGTVPDRACCCLARPLLKVIMPVSDDRPEPVDLWLCGHHGRIARESLAGAGAEVTELELADEQPDRSRASAAV
jgi:hypothetical protein